MVSDTVGDFIIQLKNAGMVRKEQVSLPYSKLKHAIADKLKEAGYVSDVAVDGKDAKKQLAVTLKYSDAGAHAINGVKRMSKPGRRMYRPHDALPRVRGGYGVLLVSTPQGVMIGAEARQKKIGGEILAKVW